MNCVTFLIIHIHHTRFIVWFLKHLIILPVKHLIWNKAWSWFGGESMICTRCLCACWRWGCMYLRQNWYYYKPSECIKCSNCYAILWRYAAFFQSVLFFLSYEYLYTQELIKLLPWLTVYLESHVLNSFLLSRNFHICFLLQISISKRWKGCEN